MTVTVDIHGITLTPGSGGGSGDVTGPGSSTDNAAVRFDGTTGKIIQNSLVTISDSGNITTPANIAVNNTNAYYFNGLSDGNWILGKDIGGYTQTIITSNSLQFLIDSGAGQGFSIGSTNGTSIFEILNTGQTYLAGNLGLPGATLTTGGAIKTGTTATNTALLQAYNVDGAAYTTFATLTAANTPTMDLSTAVTIGGAVIYRVGGTDVALADGGTGASLTDPNADRILFWDDSANQVTWLTAGSGLDITGTTLTVMGAGTGDVVGPNSATDNAITRYDGTTGKLIQNSGVIIDDSNNITAVNSLTLVTTGQIKTASSAGNTLLITAHDVDGASETTFITLTANNTPTCDLSTAVTIGGAAIYRVGGTDVALADGGTGASLADPNADRIYFWDDSAGTTDWLIVGSGLVITDKTLTVDGAGTGNVTGPANSTDNAMVRFDGTSGLLIQNSGVIVDDSNNVSGVASLTLATGGAVRTGTSAGNTVLLQAYDVDGTAYVTFGTLTANNTPTYALAAPSGGTLTIDGATIGDTTAAAGTFTTVNKVTVTAPASSATLTLADGSSLVTSGANSITLTSTGATNITLPTSGTLTTTSNNLSVFAATTSAQLAGVISDETGTGVLVFGTAPTLSNPVVGTQSTSDNSTKAASTAYVTTAIANAIAGVNPAVAVQVATTQASDTSGLTYNNGASGIGATLTGSVNTPIVWDGYTFTALGQRGLVKNDTQSPSGAFNGVYYVTQVESGILPPILTRALDYNQPSDINNTGAIPVVNGTVNASTSWLLTTSVTTVGTDPLTYTQFTYNPANIVTLTGTQTLTNKTFGTVTMSTGGGIRTSTSAGNTALIQAYDVDGTAYTTFATLTANNTPTLDFAVATTIGSNKIVGSSTASSTDNRMTRMDGTTGAVIQQTGITIDDSDNITGVTKINKVVITAPASSATLTLADGSSLITSGANSITLTSTGTTNVTLPTTGTLVNNAVTTLSSLASIGTITTGVWQGSVIGTVYGGTGVSNNAASTLTISGAFATTLTVSNTTTVTLPTTGTLATLAGTEALTNKTLDNTNTITVKDANFTLQDDGGTTRQAQFQLSGITAGQTRTVTLPDSDTTLPIATQVITFSGPSAARTYTFPNASTTVLTTNAAVTVAQGGTGIASGTSGGIPYFSGSTTIASSAALAANGVVVGGGAGTTPATTPVTVSSTGAIAAYLATINAQTGTTYTLDATDTGKIVELNNASAITLTLPNSLSVGWCATISQTGAGQVTFTAGSGATLRNRSSFTKTAGQWAECNLYVTTNAGGSSAVYILGGDGA